MEYGNYKELILLISETIKSKRDRKFIVDNIDIITKSFIYLNKTLKSINTIITESTHYLTKLNKIQLLGFTQQETKEIIAIIGRGMFGGGEDQPVSIDSEMDSQVNKIPNLILAVPKNIIHFLSNGLESISHLLSSSDENQTQDFKEPLDIMYIFLFITASIPIVGALSDFITICRAFKQEKRFLAILTVITRFLSFFTLNIIDLGLIFKIFYSLDSYSYQNYSKLKIKNVENNI